MTAHTEQHWRDELAAMRARLDEAEQTLQAIRAGEVDALIVGDALYTLDSANASSNRLRSDVLAQMKDAVIAVDNDLRVVYINPAAVRQYGLSASQSLGHPLRQIYTARWYTDDDRRSADAAIHADGAWRGELLHIRADGQPLHMECTVTALRDAGAQIGGRLIVSRDVSERYRAAEALREATEQLQRRQTEFSTLVENAPFIFGRYDLELRHTYVSPLVEKYTGHPAAAFIGRRHSDLDIPGTLSEKWEGALRSVLLGGQVKTLRYTFPSLSGELCHFESRLIPERSSDGNIESVLSITIDITERELADIARRAAADALVEQDRRKDIFLATLAHELRNPLAPIGNALQIMNLSSDMAQQQHARGVIERQLRQLVHLVDDLLDVSRISHGKVALRKERILLATVIRNAVETSRPVIAAGDHALVLDLAATAGTLVEGDMTRLTQVVANLLNNAAKYTPAGGRIVVATKCEDDQAVIRVTDNGLGIPAHRLGEVFEMFTQIEDSAGRAQGGLGIGLALVKHLVEMHGGRVAVASEGVGCGSCFEIRLPTSLLASQEVEAPDRPGAMLPGNGSRVLVVDDNRDSADCMAEVLSLLGFETAVAYDGDEALAVAEALRPRAAILDLGMPKLGGEEVARRLRAEAWASDMLLIALSGWGRDDDRRRTAKAGFDHHFVKPVDFDSIVPLLAKAVEKAR